MKKLVLQCGNIFKRCLCVRLWACVQTHMAYITLFSPIRFGKLSCLVKLYIILSEIISTYSLTEIIVTVSKVGCHQSHIVDVYPQGFYLRYGSSIIYSI